MLRSEAIKNLLNARTHHDLAAMYSADMEVQINVAQDGGERIDGDYKGRIWHGWSDGINKWFPFRIPKDAKTEPVDNDFEIKYDLAAHVEGIGMTGWDWRNKLSRWVAFDFDAISGHSDRHEKKLSESQLDNIQKIVSDIPWVTVRLSTSGKGLHLYVLLEPITTNNHTEHAAVARSILGLMASITGFDFQSKADVVGGNMWVWHRKMIDTSGLAILKQGTTLKEIPINWREHINVVSGRSKRIIPAFVEESKIENLFQELCGQKTRIPLDEEHQRLIKYLHENKATSWWDSDNHLLVCHTYNLKEAHKALNFKGIFETDTPATELGVQNCFAHPLRKGGWIIRRFTRGVGEAKTWDQDGSGFTRCYYNQEPDLKTAALSTDGVEHQKGGFVFRTADNAIKTAKLLGVNVELPSWILQRNTKIKQHKDGRLLIEVTQENTDPPDQMSGWLAEKKVWSKLYNITNSNPVEPEAGNYDDMVRHLITENHEDCGWVLKSDKEWREEPLVHVRTFLQALHLKGTEINEILGACIAKPWRLVCRPFEPEVLGDRDWNRNSPQLAFAPTSSDALSYPTWMKVLNHCGKSLDAELANDTWAKDNGILSGADYLKCWIASVFKEPSQPLPYLFLYGEQNCGKSMLHEAIALLVTGGVVEANTALISQSGFNAELENSIVAYVEELDLKNNKVAYNRIKDWVTAIKLSIHPKFGTPYPVRNTTHWIHATNDAKSCPVLPGDTRITMLNVSKLDVIIPKREFRLLLEKEAPDFLAAILAVELPKSGDRLNIPVIRTSEKIAVEQATRNYLDIFIDEFVHYVPGKFILYGEFYDRFIEWIDADAVKNWNKLKVGQNIPSQFIKGRSRGSNQVIIGNMAWEAKKPHEINLPKFVLRGEHLVEEGKV